MSTFISLDLSTNTGYAIFKKTKLIKYDVFTIKVPKYKAAIKSFEDFPPEYPINFYDTAIAIADECVNIIKENNIKNVVIEHPEGAKQRISQRLLEWTHFALIQRLHALQINYKYLLVHDWRNVVNCYIKHWPEYQKYNQKVRTAKKKATPTKNGTLVAKIDGKRVGPVNQKKLSIIIANEKYNIDTKNDNIADAINMGTAAIELSLF